MSYILTVTGKYFDPLKPEAELIDKRDIAHSISLLCRANGHLKHFYSVAQHCINCANEAKVRGYSKKVQFACLLHDAAEAYISDVIRPIKSTMPEYKVYEDRLLEQIWTKFIPEVLIREEREQVFEIDDDMLSYEFLHLMPDKIGDRYQNILSTPNLECQSPLDVEKEYLLRFEQYFHEQIS